MGLSQTSFDQHLRNNNVTIWEMLQRLKITLTTRRIRPR
jgi:hypothetical protein